MRWTIRTKLYALSMLGLLLAVAVGISGYWGLARVQKGLEEVSLTGTALKNHLEANQMHFALRGDVMAALVAPNAKAKEKALSEFAEHAARIRAFMMKNNDLPLSKDIKAGLRDIQPVMEEYIQSADVMVKLAVKDRNAASGELEAFDVVVRDMETKMDRLSEEVVASAKKSENGGHSTVAAARNAIFFICSLSLLLLMMIATTITRSIVAPMNPLIQSLKDVAEGDLSRGIDQERSIRRNDEIGEVARWFNTSVEKLRDIIGQLAGTAQRVASASEQISSSATQQSQGADAQKDQTHQVATAMQEMSSTVVQVAENASRAAEAARQAADTARQGGKIVDETLAKMRTIAQSVGQTAKQVQDLGVRSEQIGQIIGVIDEIADQTNLLALNAAIEAARAGEQGRGFAVVADEVRKLAERTSKATKEIAQMIKSIQGETKSAVLAMQTGNRQVEEGLTTTAQAGESLGQIITMAERVGEMVTHIAAAASQQSGATEEVSGNMEQISKISQDTAIGAQQTAKSCHELSELALDLQNLVGQFKIAA